MWICFCPRMSDYFSAVWTFVNRCKIIRYSAKLVYVLISTMKTTITMNQLLLCITFITFLIRISGYFPYYCGCNYAIGCYDDSSCCNGLVCVFNNGYSQCHEDPQYTKPSTSVPPCLHTNTDWGCRRNSDCCNPAAICGPQKICIFNQTCTMNYRYTKTS